jgi:hypothetical protein
MIVQSGKGEESDYESIADSLTALTFQNYSINEYKAELLNIANRMINLDDINFDIEVLHNIRRAFS